jgi:hypothetical protein
MSPKIVALAFEDEHLGSADVSHEIEAARGIRSAHDGAARDGDLDLRDVRRSPNGRNVAHDRGGYAGAALPPFGTSSRDECDDDQ